MSASHQVYGGWRTARQEELPAQLLGTGLGLFGLREVPFVARQKEREQIWNALCEVVDQGGVRVIFLTGEAGTGKSRLVRWMATRAHEVGAVEVLRTLHTPGGAGPTAGLAGLVQRVFCSWDLSRGDFYEHITRRLPQVGDSDEFREVDARGLTELVHPTEDSSDVDGPRYHFSTPRQKLALMTRLLRRLSQRRTALLWLDDLHHGPQALQWVKYLLESDEERPAALVLATLRSDVLAEDETLRNDLSSFETDARCTRIDVGPIDPENHGELVRRMLPLAPGISAQLAELTEGNPLFAHQLLSNWINTENVVIGEEGFEASDDGKLPVPDDIHALWMARIDRLAAQYPSERPDELREMVELAAATGREVDEKEWRAVCADAGHPPPERLVDDLLERGLAERNDEGWSFAHGLLVEAVARSAAEARRWSSHHARWARVLDELYRERPRETARRRAEHWIEAGDLERALPLLLAAGEQWFELGDQAQQRKCLERHREILDRLDVDADDPRRLENDLRMSSVRFLEGDTEAAIADAESVLARCGDLDESTLALRAQERLAKYLWRLGEVQRGTEAIEAARELAEDAGDPFWQGKVVSSIGSRHFFAGEYDEAAECYRRAMECFRRDDALYDALRCDAFLGWVLLSQGKYDVARERFEQVAARAKHHGFRKVESHCLTGLGDAARLSGDLDAAGPHYEQSKRHAEEMGNAADEIAALWNLTQVELARGNFDRGRTLLRRAQSQAERTADGQHVELFDCAHLILACHGEDWSEVERRFSKYATGWPADRPIWRDHPWLLEIAAGYAKVAGALSWTEKLLELARKIWRRLGDDDAAARLDEQIAGMESRV